MNFGPEMENINKPLLSFLFHIKSIIAVTLSVKILTQYINK